MLSKSTRLIHIALAATLTACSGGTDTNTNSSERAAAETPSPAPTPAPPTSVGSAIPDIVRGAVTGFGSIFIDGRRFDTSGADFLKDDESASQSDLHVGMVVELHGDADAGTASRVEFEEDVKGPVDAVNGEQIIVMGQTVQITPETLIDDGLDVAAVVVGDILEVSGFRDLTDAISASFVEDEDLAAVRAFKVIGQVRDLDAEAQTFRIGGLTVDYRSAVLDDVTLANGASVEVKDEHRTYSAGDLSLLATKIEPAGLGADLPDGGIGAFVRVEGLVTAAISGSRFAVGDTVVRINPQTAFVFGDATLLTLGAKVQVEGRKVDDSGIEALQIRFSRNSARIHGIVESRDLDANTLSILGITVDLGRVARMEDKADDEGPFDLVDILAGDFLEIRGSAADDRVFANEVERDDVDDTRLRGVAENVDPDARTLSIHGVAIVTSGATQYEGVSDNALSAEGFFAALHDGQTLVQATWDGSVTDATVAVQELSLED